MRLTIIKKRRNCKERGKIHKDNYFKYNHKKLDYKD